MRWFTPIILLAAAAWTWWSNTQHPGSTLVFPGLDLLAPSLRADPLLWGNISSGILAALGAFSLGRAVRSTMLDRRG